MAVGIVGFEIIRNRYQAPVPQSENRGPHLQIDYAIDIWIADQPVRRSPYSDQYRSFWGGNIVDFRFMTQQLLKPERRDVIPVFKSKKVIDEFGIRPFIFKKVVVEFQLQIRIRSESDDFIMGGLFRRDNRTGFG